MAAMITVYGARSGAEAMIAGRHPRARPGRRDHHRRPAPTPPAIPELLDWVQATAGYGFMEAYSRLARPLSPAERDAFLARPGPPPGSTARQGRRDRTPS
jgi:uncharacterized protein (DUF2236 family)